MLYEVITTYDKDGLVFIENCIRKKNNTFSVPDQDLNNIPESGPVVILFNHPYGGLDALVIIKAVLSKRPDSYNFV